jgi:diguanylate cyclase (GGDEF)-like protein
MARPMFRSTPLAETRHHMVKVLARPLRPSFSWRPGETAGRRASVAVAVLIVALCLLAVVGSRAAAGQTAQGQQAADRSDRFMDARFDAAHQESALRKYIGTRQLADAHGFQAATRQYRESLRTIERHEAGAEVRELLREQQQYTDNLAVVLERVADGRSADAADLEQRLAEPVMDRMTSQLSVLEESHHQDSVAQLESARAYTRALELGTPLVLGLVLLLILALWLATRGHRRSLRHQALHDALTGLPNRLLFANRATQAIAVADRVAGEPVVMIMLDLDRFKEVNDTLGHHHGDRLLVETATRIAGVLRPGDTVCRLGGDEFAVLLPEGGEAVGIAVAERIAAALEPAFSLDGVAVSVEASMGVAAQAVGPDTDPLVAAAERAAELLRHADIAMYEAKAERSGYSVYRAGSADAPPARLALLGELREAMNNDELVVYYQPKIATDSYALLGVEALVRWNHPTRGLLPPADFIALAEATTLIQPLTTIVVGKALTMSREWLDRGVRLPVAVNVSARCLLDPEFPAKIAVQLTAAGVPADHLCVELTESTFMVDPDRALAIMQQLRALGVRLSVDDFGTGYSSMAYLKILPVDELKVDRSFVTHMITSPDDSMLVQSAIDLGHNLGMSVVAEGVEDHETLLALRDLGADVIQGYFLGRPMDPATLAAWMHHRPSPATSDEPEEALLQIG